MNIADIIILVMAGAFALLFGFGMARFSYWFKNHIERKRALAFLSGKGKNEIVLDGERVNINKFVYKGHDKKFVVVEIPTVSKIVDSGASKRR